MVGVVEGGDAVFELWIIGDLNDDIHIGLSLLVEVPDEDLVDVGGLFEVDLNPLRTGSQFHEAAIGTVRITVGDEFKVANDGSRIGTGDRLAGRQDHGALGSLEGLDDLARVRRFEVGKFGRNGRSDKHGLGELGRDLLHVGIGNGRSCGCCWSIACRGRGVVRLSAGTQRERGDGRETGEGEEGLDFHGLFVGGLVGVGVWNRVRRRRSPKA